MAITIDYSDATPQYVINVPRADMTLITTTPSEIRQLSIDDLRGELGALQASAEGMAFLPSFFHTPPFTIAAVTLARVVEILDPFVLQFEDGLYSVNIVGGNSNISDKIIKNQVGVNTANSAGLQDPFALQAGAFFNEVSIDITTANVGTTFPVGTRGFPVNNLADALLIAVERGIATFRILSDMTITAGDFSEGYVFLGDGTSITSLTVDASPNVIGCEFKNMTITGSLDNGNTITECAVDNIAMFQGVIKNSCLRGTITLGAGGSAALILYCHSGVPGGGAGEFPTIDMGGAAGIDLAVRSFNGGLEIKNCTAAGTVASVDMNSGRVLLDATLTAGDFVIRGIADLLDASSGATVTDQTLSTKLHLVTQMTSGNVVVSGDGSTITVYEPDAVTVLATYSVTPDQRTMTRLT